MKDDVSARLLKSLVHSHATRKQTDQQLPGAFGNALLLHREYHGSELNNDSQLQAV